MQKEKSRDEMIDMNYNDDDHDDDHDDESNNVNHTTENLNDVDEVDNDEVENTMNESDDGEDDDHDDEVDEDENQDDEPKHTRIDDVHKYINVADCDDELASNSREDHGDDVKDTNDSISSSLIVNKGGNDNNENRFRTDEDEVNLEIQQQRQQLAIDSDSNNNHIDQYMKECTAMIRYIKKLENVELGLRVQNEILAREALLNGYRPDHLYDPTIKIPFVSTTTNTSNALAKVVAKRSTNPTAKRKIGTTTKINTLDKKSALDSDSNTPKKIIKRKKSNSLPIEESVVLVPESFL